MKLRKYNGVIPTLAVLCLAALAIAADKPDFSGEWRLNTARSDFGGRPSPTSAVLKIDHKDPILKVVRTMVTGNGEITTQAAYSTDGKETMNKLPDGREMTNTARWEGSTLVIQTPVSLNGANFSIRWKWTLSEDGRTLATTRTFAPGEQAQTETYEKK